MESQRLDKWLWCARFFKTRSLATKQCLTGLVRIDGAATTKAHYSLRSGEVLTFRLGDHIRVVKVLALAARRGPASEAQALYDDLAPPSRETRLSEGAGKKPGGDGGTRPRGAGRPTKRDRRKISRLKDDL